jgi:hypothetical protein
MRHPTIYEYEINDKIKSMRSEGQQSQTVYRTRKTSTSKLGLLGRLFSFFARKKSHTLEGPEQQERVEHKVRTA